MTIRPSGAGGVAGTVSGPYVLPASFAQERLWFFSQLVPDVAVYNIGYPVELSWLDPEPDPGRFEAALAEVVQRHETLRCCLSVRDGELVQLTYPSLRPVVERTDLRGLIPGQRDARAMELAHEDAATPIPLDRAPLWRARLIQRDDNDWLLVFVTHHAICDAQSTFNFLTELRTAYAMLSGNPGAGATGLPALPIQYGDFAAWQRSRLAAGELDEQIAFWKKTLADLPPPLKLPTVVPPGTGRPDDGNAARYRGGAVAFGLDAQTAAAARTLARDCQTTPFVVLISGLATLLQRLTGQTDIVVGSPVSGRVTPELEPLIGMFVNTLVLRMDCSGDPTFAGLVRRVRGTVLDALEHQEVPYDRLVEILRPDRGDAGSPLHQVVLNLLPAIQNDQIRNNTAKVDLLIDVAECDGGYDGRLEYRSSVLDESAATTLAGRFCCLLKTALTHPDLPIGRLPIMADGELRRVLAAAMPPSRRQPPAVVVTEMFASQVAAGPGAAAVADVTGRRLSYGELDRQSSRLARHLSTVTAVGPDSPVALLLENGADLAVAVLAVLKAGTAYLPLDEQHPPERLRYLIEDSGAVAVITCAQLADRLPAATLREREIPVIMTGAVEIARHQDTAPGPRPHPDALAYVIYTSGSTGKPKGVGVTHRNLAAYIDEIAALLALERGRVFSQLQPLTFDFAVTMFYGALATGGTLHLAPRDFAADGHWVAEHLRKDRVDYLKITPSHLLALQAGAADPAALLPRRALLLGGEASGWDWMRALRTRRNGCAVINHYGPTETTVGALALPADSTPAVRTAAAPLGLPMAHARAYVLDANLDPVPDGVAGELCIGGVTVSRGYLGRPGLTADRFVPDPFAGHGARLYRTGDLASRLPTGEIEFLGRSDDQVKVRGHRVELGEVQQVLAAAPGVAACAVVLAGEGSVDAAGAPRQPRLIAYIVTAGGGTFDAEALREHAAQRLPDFMLPSVFVPLDALPLAAHGKVDRSRLPDPDAGATATGHTRPPGPARAAAQAPRDGTEEMVASLFERLLEREQVGREDSFFALGGHSLLAIQLVTRLRAAFGVGMPLRAVFENPTVAAIAAKVGAQRKKRVQTLPPVRALPRPGALPTSYGQRRLWFLDKLEAGPDGGPLYNTNICLRVSGPLDPGDLQQALRQIAARHEVLRCTFAERDGDLMQIPAAEPAVPLAVLGLPGPEDHGSRPPEDEAYRLLGHHASRRFDLAAEPPVRAAIVPLDATTHLLLITVHHVANDAWSAAILTRELAECYAAVRQGRTPRLPGLQVQYADYAVWQREMLEGPLRDTQLAYWRDRLDGMPPRLELPADHPSPARRGHAGAHAPFSVPPPIAERLRALGADENASLFMTLLAGFLALLHRYTGQDDLVIGTPAASRQRPELEPLIGFFLNTLPLRVDCSGDPPFRELLRRVQATVLEAFANQDVPFEALVEELHPGRDLGSTPLVQHLFTLEDAQRPTVSAAGAEFEWEPFGTPTAKFDITVYLWRRPDGLTGSVEYRTDLFEADTMRRFADHYTTLLEGAAADPGQTVSGLPLLTAAEVGLLGGWNATGVVWPGVGPGEGVVPGWLAAAARRWPGAAGVWAGGEWVGLGALVERVNRWAWWLAGQGVRAGDVVGVLLERGVDLVVAVHAVQAAGGAYLPLDPADPPARLAFMCADAGVRVVITTAALASLLPTGGTAPTRGTAPTGGTAATGGTAGTGTGGGAAAAAVGGGGVRVVLAEQAAAALASQPAGPVPVAVHPQMLAYVLYTSGSTGQPKAVAVSHAAIVNRLRWMQHTFPLGPTDRVLHKTPATFDVSVWELCWPLLAGAGLIIADPGGHRDTSYLITLAARQHVSTAHFVPSMLAAFLDEDHTRPGGLAAALPTLRQVFSSGEPLPPALATRFTHTLPTTALHNLYGPTEAAIDVTWHPCTGHDDPLPIGTPIANTHIRILDPTGQQTPIGVPGELCIAGPQLAHGYLHRPALTAAAFTPDPHGPPGTRLYHTGDHARWLPTGTLQYLGRRDHQIKIRGMRAELGEIEAALTSHPHIAAAAATTHPTPTGPTLTGYLVPTNPDHPPTPTDLHDHLATTLPPHMIPTTYQILPHLPTTPSGKLHRTALPPPQPTQTDDAVFVEPASPEERAVATTFREVLGGGRIGAQDDFFALGGDSIRTLKVIALLREAGYAATLEQIFLYPTVRALAAALTAAISPGQSPSTGPAAPAEPFSLIDPATADQVRAKHQAEDAYPITALQAGMIFHGEYGPDRSTYHDVFTMLVTGACDAGALRAAAGEVVARHPVLRTSFHIAEFGEPLQVVHQAAAAPVIEADLTGIDPDLVPAALAEFHETEKAHPFDPATPPLLRIYVHWLPAGRFALTLSFHHAILDGWSVAVLTTELLRRYVAHLAGTPLPAGPLPITYREFAAEQQSLLADPAHAQFWEQSLTGAPDTRVPSLPGRDSRGTGPAETVSANLPGPLLAGLEAAARTSKVPLRTVLLAVHLRVLALVSGGPDVVSGVVTHGRPQHQAAEQVLGLYLNSVPLRVHTSQRSWSALIRVVFDAELEVLPHRLYPLPQIQRLTGRNPAFQVLFDYRDFHIYGSLPDGDRLQVAGYRFFEQTNVPFAANFIRSPADGSVALQLKYDSARFARDQAENIRERYLRALAAVAADPAADPRAAALLGPDGARIDGWNQTRHDYPAGIIPGLVAAQVHRSPQAPAVWSGGSWLSYAEFGQRVNRLANYLVTCGVAPGDVVGICLERGAELVTAVHAVLTAGAAYLPLEPAYPAERLAFMAADAAVSAVVTTSALAGRVPGQRAICLDAEAGRIAAQPPNGPAVPIPPTALAYVIFTSGSTGTPKGVGVSHAAIVNRLRWMQQAFPLTAADRVAHKTPFGFDVSVWELCWPLMTGAGLVVADPEGHRNPGYLGRLAHEQRVTVMHFVPSMLEAVLEDSGAVAGLTGLRWLLCSGEALSAGLAMRFRRALPGVALENLYGPTEAAVDVTWHSCTDDEPLVPIGRPIANTRIEVLDETGERVPIGTPGEVCIGGVQLAHGYVGRPSLTAERFVPDPAGQPPGGRLYRTGDLGRWLADGELEYLGRLDLQVKVRGFRVEPGEIEAALTAQPGIRAAVVVAREDPAGGRTLIAYVVPTAAPIDGAGLAERLRQRLPGQLIPAAFVELGELPLTRNGKLDRAALPPPGHSSEVPFEEPAPGAQAAVAAVWAEVLGIGEVSAHDNFFALGGDSIRSLRVVARLQDRGYRLSVEQLFANPTVRSLGEVIEAAPATGAQAPPGPAHAAFGLVSEADLALLRQQFGGDPQ